MAIDIPARVLVITPHPDDAEFGASGTVAKWAKGGAEVTYVLCTDGGKGTSDRSVTTQKIIEVRDQEQRDACNALGVKNLVTLSYPDGRIEYTDKFLKDIIRQIRRFKPDVVMAPDFFRKSNWHRDHRVTGQVVADACYPFARDHLHFPELVEQEKLEPHKTRTLMMWGAEEPDCFIDITETMDRKIAALKAHASQVGNNFEDRVKETARGHGMHTYSQYAEAFRRLDFRV